MFFNLGLLATTAIAAIGVSSVSGSPVSNAAIGVSSVSGSHVSNAAIGVSSVSGSHVSNSNGVRMDFLNLDGHNRTLVFTESEGNPKVADLELGPNSNTTYFLPSSWTGMIRPQMADQIWARSAVIAEFTLGGWGGMHFFDISAVDNHTDNTGFMHITTAETNKTVLHEWSGCDEHPCANEYVLWDDPGTRSTKSNHFILEIGGHPSTLTDSEEDQARLPKIKKLIRKQKKSRSKPYYPFKYKQN